MELVDCRDFYVDVHSVADILQRLANASASAPKGSWIVAHGSPMQDFRLKDKRFPDKHDLDRAVPDNPVSISFGAHITIGNIRPLAPPRSPATRPTRRRPYPKIRKPASPPASCTSAPSSSLRKSRPSSIIFNSKTASSSRSISACTGRHDGSRYRSLRRTGARLSGNLQRGPDARAREHLAARD